MKYGGWLNGSLGGFQGNHRLIVLWESYAANFLGFLQLHSIGILLKQL